MTGNIIGRDVLMHSMVVVREFGARCYLCCLKAMLIGERKTFLECAFPLASRNSRAAVHLQRPCTERW